MGKGAFKREQWKEAERWFNEVVDQQAETDAAPEALYWAGVSRYKATGEARYLGETAGAFDKQYRDTTWAKKASIWTSPG
ncbi:MAG: tol-pal system YbgF family protein [Gemmatimonadaceae bacterium]